MLRPGLMILKEMAFSGTSLVFYGLLLDPLFYCLAANSSKSFQADYFKESLHRSCCRVSKCSLFEITVLIPRENKVVFFFF